LNRALRETKLILQKTAMAHDTLKSMFDELGQENKRLRADTEEAAQR
jgi:hypothetical protein